MEYNAFDGGIDPGGLRNKEQIRLLICYILEKSNYPLSSDSIIEILQQCGLANYFEAADSVSNLIKNNNIIPDKNNNTLYTVSDSGRIISRQLEIELPASVKDKALGAVLLLIDKQRTEKENQVKISKTDNGYNVNCNISDGQMTLLSFDIYVPEKNQANTVKRNFHKDPNFIYQTMIAMLTGNKDFAESALQNITNAKKRGKTQI